MELPWKELVKVYAPVIILASANLILGAYSAIYMTGFRDGQKRLLDAARTSAMECKHG